MASVAIGTAEDGQVVHAAVNDTIVIRLPENPTTGVRWDVEEFEDSLRLTGDEYEHPVIGGIGAAAIRVLTLQPLGPGQIKLKLKRWQKFEGASSIDATFSCTLVIERGPSRS